MAHIHLIHNADDSEAAERVADVLYFLDYDVNLLTRESPDPESVSEGGSGDVVLVLWTTSAQKDRWVTAQCRDIDDPERLVTIVPKTSGSPALPLMLHRGCIIHLEHPSGRMRNATLQTLLSEIGRRSGRDGLVSGVAALLRPNEDERVQALAQWVAANPDDPLAPTVHSVLETRATGEIYNALLEITDGVIVSNTGLKDIAGGVASRFKLPTRATPMMYYAAIGVVAAGAFLATLLPIINRPTETVEFERIDVRTEMASSEDSDVILSVRTPPTADEQPETSSISDPDPVDESGTENPASAAPEEDLSDNLLADVDTMDAEGIEAVGDVEAEYVIDPLPTLDAAEGASLALEGEEPSLGVPDPDEVVTEAAIIPAPEEPVVAPEEPLPSLEENVAQTSVSDPAVDEAAEASLGLQQAELLLPYIRGTQQPGDAFTDRLSDETGAPVMVVIPSGIFQRGSPLSERGRDISEGPRRSVSIGRPFAVSKYEITIAEFEKFVAATNYDVGGSCQIYSNDTWTLQSGTTFRDTGYRQSPEHPVTCIDWNAASAYAEWLSEETGARYRLLSEAEWEYAARAGSNQAFPFGANADEGCGFMNGADESAPPGVSSSLALDCSDGAAHTARVGTYLPNRFGLYDMHGNVWEWTRDTWHTSYNGAPRTQRAWDTGQSSDRVVRGGSWFTYDFWLRSASRKAIDPSDRRYDVGFRVARDL